MKVTEKDLSTVNYSNRGTSADRERLEKELAELESRNDLSPERKAEKADDLRRLISDCR